MALTSQGEKFAEMFEEEHRTNGIYLEMFERLFSTNIVGMLFRLYQYAWYRKGEVKVGFSSKSRSAAVGGPADGSFVCVEL